MITISESAPNFQHSAPPQEAVGLTNFECSLTPLPYLQEEVRDDPRSGIKWARDLFSSTVLVALPPNGGPVKACWLDGATEETCARWASYINRNHNLYYVLNQYYIWFV